MRTLIWLVTANKLQSIAFSGRWECWTGWSQQVNCINIGEHVTLRNGPTVHSLCAVYILNIPLVDWSLSITSLLRRGTPTDWGTPFTKCHMAKSQMKKPPAGQRNAGAGKGKGVRKGRGRDSRACVSLPSRWPLICDFAMQHPAKNAPQSAKMPLRRRELYYRPYILFVPKFARKASELDPQKSYTSYIYYSCIHHEHCFRK